MQQWLTERQPVWSPSPAAIPTAPVNPTTPTQKLKQGMREHASTYMVSMTSHDMECSNDQSGPGPPAVLPLCPRKVNSILAETRTQGKIQSTPEGEGGGRGWMFVRQLTETKEGYLLITGIVGPRQILVTFLVDTGAQISALTIADAISCGDKRSKQKLLVVDTLVNVQPQAVLSVSFRLPEEDNAIRITIVVEDFPLNLLRINVLKGDNGVLVSHYWMCCC